MAIRFRKIHDTIYNEKDIVSVNIVANATGYTMAVNTRQSTEAKLHGQYATYGEALTALNHSFDFPTRHFNEAQTNAIMPDVVPAAYYTGTGLGAMTAGYDNTPHREWTAVADAVATPRATRTVRVTNTTTRG